MRPPHCTEGKHRRDKDKAENEAKRASYGRRLPGGDEGHDGCTLQREQVFKGSRERTRCILGGVVRLQERQRLGWVDAFNLSAALTRGWGAGDDGSQDGGEHAGWGETRWGGRAAVWSTHGN